VARANTKLWQVARQLHDVEFFWPASLHIG
jgi:hypothetical protein